jgi:hypothetical protein
MRKYDLDLSKFDKPPLILTIGDCLSLLLVITTVDRVVFLIVVFGKRIDTGFL